jgi:hypothetical protein
VRFGSLAVIKATAADTGGQMTVVEVTEAPGADGPLYVHHSEDEVLDRQGDVTLEVGDTTFEQMRDPAQRARRAGPPARAESPAWSSDGDEAVDGVLEAVSAVRQAELLERPGQRVSHRLLARRPDRHGRRPR